MPLVAILAALGLFLGIGFAVFTASLGTGGGGDGGVGYCDVGSAGAQPGARRSPPPS